MAALGLTVSAGDADGWPQFGFRDSCTAVSTSEWRVVQQQNWPANARFGSRPAVRGMS